MYNPYLIPSSTQPHPTPHPLEEQRKTAEQEKVPVLSKLPSLSFDASDILLALILLFLALDGEDYEIIITLALIFLMGLEDDS